MSFLITLTDSYGDVTAWSYADNTDTAYPTGALMTRTLGNDASTLYEYDALGQLERITERDDSLTVFDYLEFAYDPAGLITSRERKDGGSYFTTHYGYDDAYRLTEEDNKNASNVSKSKRTYAYDDAGNRASMTQWNDASVNKTTTYTYGNRNQMVSNTGYFDDGTHDTHGMDFTFDNRGNMTSREWGDGSTDHHRVEMDWNEDNRMIAHSRFSDYEEQGPYFETETITEFHYDASGRRLLKRAPRVSTSETPTQRTRYFFNGLTEEITKVSVPNAHADSAFEFTAKEDGASASEWQASNASVSTASSTSRRSEVIALNGVAPPAKMSFTIGDSNGTGSNPNDVAWDSTKRTLSFWHQGGFSKLQVLLTSSAGEKKVTYNSGTGINGHTGNNVDIYLGTTGSTSWHRFERNIEADYELYAGGATWTNTDGLIIIPDATYGSYDMNVDDIRLSDSVTVEHNTLGPGVIGHILRNTTWDDTSSLAREDKWFHYDHTGSVTSETNTGGVLESTVSQDAFGNQQPSWESGLWNAETKAHGSALGSALDPSVHLTGEVCFSSEIGDAVAKIDGGGSSPTSSKRSRFDRFARGWVNAVPPFATDPILMSVAAGCGVIGVSAGKDSMKATQAIDAAAGVVRDVDYYHDMDNAIRHCVWNCCMVAADTPTPTVKLITDWYETGDNYSVTDTPRDLHNNEIGRQLGSSRYTPPRCSDDDSCAEKCLGAWGIGGNGSLRRR